MKFYPIVFAGLLLARRQYRATAVALATAAVSMAASLWLVCPDVRVSWRGMQQGLAAFRVWYMLGYEQVGFDHSVFAGVKALWLMVSGKPLPPQSLALLLGIYMPGIAFAGIVLYFDRIRKLPVVNQVLCLTIATILLPPVSYDYTLLHLYAPWAMLVLVAMDGRERAVPGLTAAFVCLAVAMTPLSEAIVHGQGYGGQGKAVALVALFGISLRFRFGSRFDVGWMG
jgi:hypothetical protein